VDGGCEKQLSIGGWGPIQNISNPLRSTLHRYRGRRYGNGGLLSLSVKDKKTSGEGWGGSIHTVVKKGETTQGHQRRVGVKKKCEKENWGVGGGKNLEWPKGFRQGKKPNETRVDPGTEGKGLRAGKVVAGVEGHWGKNTIVQSEKAVSGQQISSQNRRKNEKNQAQMLGKTAKILRAGKQTVNVKKELWGGGWERQCSKSNDGYL